MKKSVDSDGRIYFSIKSNGKEYRYYEDDLITPDDVWDIPILQQKDPERTGFFSQKPEKLLARIVGAFFEEKDTILDFFSGSATTADAVMQLNSKDSGERKFIMVQLPERILENQAAYRAGYSRIDEIGRERIKRAASKIKEETGAEIDYGFKTFKLETIEEKTLNIMETFDPSEMIRLDDMVSMFDTDNSTGKETILATWINQDGYGLSKTSSIVKLANYTADLYKNTIYIIDEGLESEDVMELIKKIETGELEISRVVIYPYSLKFSVMQELAKNIKTLRNNKNVELIERY